MLQWLVEFEPVSRKSEWVDEWKKRRPRGGADAKWNYPTLDRVSGIVGISMQNRKSIIKIEIKRIYSCNVAFF